MTLIALFACAQSPPLTLVIDGPAEVRVDALGPVDLPEAVLMRGDTPVDAEIAWSAAPAEVATVDGEAVRALAPGRATVTGEAEEASASYTLVVDPPVTLMFVDPPARLAVGATTQLATSARIGRSPALIEGTPSFVGSNDAFATVSPAGAVTAIAPGMLYVTARMGTSEAMVEIEVVPAL